ncbi:MULTISPECIES: hypothetical protein [Mycobacterium]|uniref:hypothetical protein n=1 Tax=Mycobacterium TaxID=1763 RepID=UPI000F0126A6|nr:MULTISPECIES: hypothetical protein [Mycobacterium]MDP7732932.1 hypothetical protein [Mycobacterium sp. TY813]TDL02914.1 hypothetical protein EUA05_25800 [Mycobacterium paragordonae]VBA34682.1 hypothetical protein LAUMK35_05781 [Mycobacterium pseudokansasii]VBA36020.1 hypothetical protein LAUMK21_05760 [Mycobacterium pseudokansasii]
MDSMRYDHAMMADHVSAQANLVAYLHDQRTRALQVVGHVASVWTAHGSDAGQQAFNEINQAFTNVFATIERHGHAIAQASSNAGITDSGIAAGFRGL